MSGDFACARCGGIFKKGRTDDHALAEARELFSPAELESTAVICDDCWQEFMPHAAWIRAQLHREAAAAGITYEEFLKGEPG